MRTFIFTLAISVLLSGTANAGFVLNPFAPSTYQTDTAAMDAALGITGFAIEDFEDTTLISGLSYTLTDPAAGTFSALPATFESTTHTGTANNQWDGPRILFNNSMNAFPSEGTRTNTITFNIAGGATSFGVGLSNFQSLSSPTSPVKQFPVADHELFINGISQGLLESLSGWDPGRTLRNLYLRIDATGGDVINTVRFSNVDIDTSVGDTVDLLVFDHLAIQSASVIPEPSSIALIITGGLCLIGYRRRRMHAA